MKSTKIAIVVTSLLLSGGLAAFNAVNTEKPIEVKANTNNSSYGVFVKVDHPDWSVGDGGLADGDKVIFLATDGDDNYPVSFKAPINNGGLQRVSYTNMRDGYSHIYNDQEGNECFVLAGSCAEIFSVGRPVNNENRFTFKGVTGGAFSNYLAYAGNNGLNDSSSLNDNAYWALEGGYSIGYGLDSVPAVGIKRPDEDMHINNRNGSFECSNPAYSYFRVYKEIPVMGASVAASPNRTIYYQQDKVDFTGLKVNLLYRNIFQVDTNHLIEDVAFDDLNKIVSDSVYVTSEQNRVDFTVFPNTDFAKPLNFPITKLERVGTYVQNNGGIVDKRATYHFVREETGENVQSYIFNPLVTPQNGHIDVGGNMRPINLNSGYDTIDATNTNYSYLDHLALITVVRETVNDQLNYYYKASNGKYLAIDSDHNLYLSDTPESIAVVDATGGNGSIKIKDHGVTLLLGFHAGSDQNNSYFKFDTEQNISLHYEKVELYKRDYKESEEQTSAVTDFKDALIAATANCDNTGSQNNVDLDDWAGLVSKFNSMSEDAKGYFGSLTYNHNHEEKNSSKDLMDRYDYIVTKYGYTDFINRRENGTLKNNYSSQPVNVILNIDSTLPITIVVVSILGMSSLAFFYFTKKHPH